MRIEFRFAAITLAVGLSSVFAQDPGFRDPEVRRQPAAAQTTRDDTASAAARISSMDQLDATRPLKIGDLVSLRIVEDKDKVLSLLVQDSGDIQAPFIGLVRAAGRTCREVAFSMKTELEKQYFQQATVIVALERGMGNRSPWIQDDTGFITIYGQVARQGRYELSPEEDLTVSQAILRAGGFSQFALDTKVKVIRRKPNKSSVTIMVNLRDIMVKGRLEQDIPIRGGDVIIVDEKLVNF
ncbi:MAG: polysaccharide biosynthesis/export family protein [Roseimicrobium sp.]